MFSSFTRRQIPRAIIACAGLHYCVAPSPAQAFADGKVGKVNIPAYIDHTVLKPTLVP